MDSLSVATLVAAVIAAGGSAMVVWLTSGVQQNLNTFSATVSGELWIGQKQWQLKRDVYKKLLEVVNEQSRIMRKVARDYGWIEISPDQERSVELKAERNTRISAALAQIASATTELIHVADFSQIVLSGSASHALLELTKTLEEDWEADPKDSLSDAHRPDRQHI